ncbi:MAG: hypothetical protein HRT87_09045, partial [Legionellales bacterium]|nr:hypothetical protein [Legionellales bacterium]
MLEKAIDKLSKTGSIFLGDIRNYSLHKDLIKEKLDYKRESYTQHDINRISIKEKELLISPDYFNYLKSKYKGIKVSVLKRDGDYVNELSKYRYDVIISIRDRGNVRQITDNLEINLNNYYNIPYLNQVSKEDILLQLSNSLPDYMIPNSLIMMDIFPLTINGKLDKKAFPNADFSSSDALYVAPKTGTELALCGIWEEVLGLGRVGVTDDFFRIGGDSILSIKVSYRMSEFLEKDIKVADIFKYKTISELLIQNIENTQVVISKVESNSSVLSFSQNRLWFIEQYEGGTNAYHIPSLFEVSVDTDVEGIKYGLQKIVSRHEVLRSTLSQDVNDDGIQTVCDYP